jgi:alkylhydroperoxidase/carboxymuconolactone decarboxylase family protein YurZ
MTTPKPSPWQDSLGKSAPELFKHYTELQSKIMVDGALSAKTKTLMMLLCDALLSHPDGVAGLSKRARSLGATEREIGETLAIAFLMGGLPGLVTGANAFRE